MKGLFVSALIALGFLALVAALVNAPVGGNGSTLFNIAKGDGVTTIAQRLADAKLIRSKTFFLLTVWSRGDRNGLKAGSYELSPSMTTRDLERALVTRAPISNEREIRLLEGWTLDDIAGYLEREGVASKAAFSAQAGRSAKAVKVGELPDWKTSFPALADRPDTASLEGYLFPDTYRIYAGSGVNAVVIKMLGGFEAKLTPDLRAEIARRKKTTFDIVTMASIIEREVRGDDDRAMVSDIFWRRVAAGRGLEADSTVNYVTGGSSPSISYQETRLDSPWNTYKYKGLPPGPIGNPGLSAIRAAIYPKPNAYWYFLTDPQGNVHYAKTLDEHNLNKVRYLR